MAVMPEEHLLELVDFDEANTYIAKDQPEYRTMPAHIGKGPESETTVCWKLTWRQRLILLITGELWHSMWTFRKPMQPQRLSVSKPELK